MTIHRFTEIPTGVNALVVDFDLTGKELLVVALLAQLGSLTLSEETPENTQQANEIVELLDQWEESEALAEQALVRLQAVLLASKASLANKGIVS